MCSVSLASFSYSHHVYVKNRTIPTFHGCKKENIARGPNNTFVWRAGHNCNSSSFNLGPSGKKNCVIPTAFFFVSIIYTYFYLFIFIKMKIPLFYIYIMKCSFGYSQYALCNHYHCNGSYTATRLLHVIRIMHFEVIRFFFNP